MTTSYISYGKILPSSSKLRNEKKRFGDLILIEGAEHSYLKRAFEKIASYAEMECNFSFEKSLYPRSEVYVFTKTHKLPECPGIVYGGCLFQHGYWEDEKAPRWSLRWIWLHPYYRRKGVLSEHWSYFTETYGEFHLAKPLSNPIQNFLRNQKGALCLT
jgi:hypothetical protein